ncbi:MAG: histidine kinase, partial [Actinomycetota bacterium]
ICVVLVMAVSLVVAVVVVIPITWLTGSQGRADALFPFLIGILLWPLWRLSRRIADRLVFGQRSSPYEVLAEFSERLSESYATDDVLPRMARIVHEATAAASATVWLRVGREIRPAAISGDLEPGGAIPLAGDGLPELPADLAVEVRHQGSLLGALSVIMHANDPMNTAKERLVRDLAAQAGLVLRNVRLIEELRDSRRRLVAAQDLERRKIERNIHDGAQQQLVAIQVKLRLAKQLAGRDAAKSVELLEQLQADAGAAIEDLRDLARGIYPPLLADKGLAAALEAQARKAAIPIAVRADDIGRYPQEIEAAVYFACLEALQNTAKYAEASHATIELERSNGSLSFRVEDDGRGFDASAARDGTGLPGIVDRLEAIGGELFVESMPGRGTTIRGAVRTPSGTI